MFPISNSGLLAASLIITTHFALGVGSNSLAIAQEGADTEVAAIGTKLLFNRQQAISGIAHGEGTITIPESSDRAHHFRFIYVFDRLQDSVKFDYTKKLPVRAASETTGELREVRTISARSHKSSMSFNNHSSLPRLWLDFPDRVSPHDQPGLIYFFDPMSCGLRVGYGVFSRGTLESEVESLFKSTKVGYSDFTKEELGDGIVKYEFKTAEGAVFKRYWINVDNGFTIEKYEFGNTEAVRDSRTYPEQLLGSCEVSWTEVSEVYVPSSYSSSWLEPATPSSQRARAGSTSRKMERRQLSMKLDWSHINESISEQEFLYESFGLPAGTMVYDNRPTPPVYVERIDALKQEPSMRLSWKWILLGGLSAVAVVFLVSR